MRKMVWLGLAGLVAAGVAWAATGEKAVCKYCGAERDSVQALVRDVCPKHPAGFAKGRHAAFEGELERLEFYCVHCGMGAKHIKTLVLGTCPKHPDGFGKGAHVPYEGRTAGPYTCRFCGQEFGSIRAMTSAVCARHPDGFGKGRHSPAR
ncbi:MAG: hypothetical protein IJT88_09985 [Kiritimatiellae bacterium]|nr:hypothetical protein [Kiritimatiellia bacterium]